MEPVVHLISRNDVYGYFHQRLFVQEVMHAGCLHWSVAVHYIDVLLAIEVITGNMAILGQQFLLEEQCLDGTSRQPGLPLLLNVNQTTALPDILQIL